VKTSESIAVIPSAIVTSHVKGPQVVKLLKLFTAASVQLKVATASLRMYVKAGELNTVLSKFKESERQGLGLLVTWMLKFWVF